MNENIHQKECSLYLSNIDLELKLNDENKQILHRITKYMKSFYLEEYETEILRKDLIGMALETETRGETLQNIIGDNINDFCDELIQAELGITIPKGKKLLHFASNLFIIKGMYILVILSFVLLSMAILPYQQFLNKISKILPSEGIIIYFIVESAIVGSISLFSGIKGRKMAAKPNAAKICLLLGIVCVLLDVMDCLVTIFTKEPMTQTPETTILNIIIMIIYCGIPVLYIVGAKKNLDECNLGTNITETTGNS